VIRATEEWRSSFVARIRAVHALWQLGIADLTIEQVNHLERARVLPVAFTLLHYVVGEDRNGRFLGQSATLWDEQGWAKRVGLVGEPPVRGTPMADAEKLRLRDLGEWRAYQGAVFERTERAIVSSPLAIFAAKAERPPPERLVGSFLGYLVPEGEMSVADVCEAYIFQHACRHLGELEHARALVGSGGLS
jgi:hypothetical protein